MAATTVYYLVRDESDELVAIHRTPDSAKAAVEKLSKTHLHLRLEIEKVTVDQWGTVIISDVIFRLVCEGWPKS